MDYRLSETYPPFRYDYSGETGIATLVTVLFHFLISAGNLRRSGRGSGGPEVKGEDTWSFTKIQKSAAI